MLLGLVVALVQLVQEFPVIHDPADRRLGLGRDLDEVQAVLAGKREGLGRGHDAEQFFVLVDHPEFAGMDHLVQPMGTLLGGRREGLSS